MGQELTLFSLIPTGPQRNELFQKMISDKCLIALKNNSEDFSELKVCSLSPQGDIQCHAPEGLPFSVPKDGLLTCSFNLKSEKYMMEVRPIVSENLVTLKVEVVFHLQRRKNFRYKIPKNTDAYLQIKTLNHQPVDYQCVLTDLSTEGCSALIGMDEVSLNIFDQISAQVVIDQQKPIKVQGLLKNLRLYDESRLTVGLEFDYVSESCESAITDGITYLQRRAHTKKAA